MKHIIIGTAGHVDHGKTTLIKALTGKDTDRLKEEKERGISIELGFTFFDLPSGRRAGIIDVPGHEKFIKNMLAGVSSIDVVLLVIAADEGIMPQTREHFQILELLNVKKSIIVITKCDLVENDWISMIEEDIRNEFKNTTFKNAPICRISSKNGAGIENLISLIDKKTEEVEAKDIEGHFRLPVDRSFSISGFGTVVTGTIVSGKVRVGESIQIYPSMILSKVRGIQVHDESVDFAEAGQRCALNIANIKSSEVKRGDIISNQEVMEPSLMIDCYLHYLNNAEKPLENRQRVRLYHGTKEILGRVILLDNENLKPGEQGYVQFRLEEVITAQRGDRYVIRSYSPMHTIGGGEIIDPNAAKAKRFDEKHLDDIKVKQSGETENLLENTIEKLSSKYPDINLIVKGLGRNEEDIDNKVQKLLDEKRIIKLSSGDRILYIHKNFVNNKIDALETLLLKFHNENPLKAGVSKEEIKNKIFGKDLKQRNYDEILKLLEERDIITIKNNMIALYSFKILYTEKQKVVKESIYKAFSEGELSPPKYDDLLLLNKDKNTFNMVFNAMVEEGILIKLSNDAVFLNEHYEKAKNKIKEYLGDKGSITLAEARDLFNNNRKLALELLENFDDIKITKRLEDKRVLY